MSKGEPKAGVPDRIWMSVSKKVNLGNYESIAVDFGSAVDVKPGQDKSEAVVELLEEVQDALEVSLDVVIKRFG
jgi:hypothetical protein